MMTRIRNSFALGLSIGLIVALVFGLGTVTGVLLERSKAGGVSASDRNVQEFLSAYQLLTRQSYNQHLNHRQLIYAAIDGMMTATGDPHTTFLPPQEQQIASQELNGSNYAGIGAIVVQQGSKLRVVAPLPHSPASAAGLHFNDIITAINGISVATIKNGSSVARIHGKTGTVVKLTVQRGSRTLIVPVKRAEIPAVTAYARPLPHHLALLSIFSFGSGTASDVREALSQPQVRHARGLVLDLRGNPGGYVSAAQSIVSMFVDSGVVAYERSSDGSLQALPVQKGQKLVSMPVTVLVDRSTASAAEITAAALRDDDRAVLIGTRTYGKGSMQSVYNLSDGSSLHITDKLWLTPDKHSIQGTGLTPDLQIPAGPTTGNDPQLRAAETYLASHAGS
jgi:carboxyl-terminal processing protease